MFMYEFNTEHASIEDTVCNSYSTGYMHFVSYNTMCAYHVVLVRVLHYYCR